MESGRKDYSMPIDAQSPRIEQALISKEDDAFMEFERSISEQDEYTPERHVFGRNTLEKIRDMRQSGGPDSTDQVELERKYLFSGLRESLYSFSNQEEYYSLFDYFVRESATDVPEFKEKFIEALRQGDESVKNIFRNHTVITDDLFEKILVNHQKRFNEQSERLEENTPYYLYQFMTKLKQKSAELNIDVDSEIIEERIKKVRVRLADSMGGMIEQKHAGNAYVELRTVHINNLVREGDQEDVIFHELMHEVSGHTSEESIRGNRPRKIGLWKFEYDEKERVKNKYSWLNEAVTETLTYELLEHDIPVYTPEVKLFGALLDQEIPPNVLYDAYFENGVGKVNAEGLTKWEQFVATIDKKYSPGFLDSLDEYVARYGVEKALASMQEDWRIIAQAHNYSSIDEASNS